MKRWTLAILPAVALAAAPSSPSEGVSAATRHRVRMIQQGTQYKFDPANLRILPGDTVDFVNVSGWPHNVQFFPNRIPPGSADVLNRAMPNRMGPLAGPMLTAPNAVYRIVFTGVPEGTYDYFCLPHQALGMTATLVVARSAAPAAPARRTP